MSEVIERCCECDEPTGRAGPTEDSLYLGEFGPYCEACFDDQACSACGGSGEMRLCRNATGEVDYLNGLPTSEYVECDECRGTGRAA